MMRHALAQAALRCYPPAMRTARGAEMLDTLLEASGDRHGVFVWNVVSLVTAGLGERARASARVSPGRTIAEAAKLASVLYACLPILPACGFLIMAIAPARERPSTVALAALAALVVVSVIVDANTGGFGQFIVLGSASIAGLAVVAVQPRLAIAVAMIWTAIGIELIAFGGTPPAPSKLLVATAPAVLAATAARARVIRRRAI